MNPCFFIFGLGYTAKALAISLVARGFKVIGTSRTPDEHQQDHLDIQLIDFESSDIEHDIGMATHLLICIPPTNASSDVVLAKYSMLIKKHAHHLKWIGYLSSTGVYGDHQGRWVTEESECIPNTSTGVARFKAEQAWFSFGKKINYHFTFLGYQVFMGQEKTCFSAWCKVKIKVFLRRIKYFVVFI